MDINSKRPKGRDNRLSSLDVAIQAMNHAKDISSITPVKTAFDSVSVLLTIIRVCSYSPTIGCSKLTHS